MILSEIITIGDELLIGQVVDTNSAWIAKELNDAGIRVKQISSVSDDSTHILDALREASERANVVLITGGLGPTKDDLTKKTLCTYFNVGYKFDEESFKIIEGIFHSRGKEVTPLNYKQAEVPENCTVLLNYLGTAPGMWFEKDGVIYVSMPGVPSEMKGLMTRLIVPKLRERFSLAPVIHKTILTQGIGESYLSDKIATWEDNLPATIKLAYLPDVGMVRLRLTATGNNEDVTRSLVEAEAEKLKGIIGDFIFGYEDDKLETIVGKLLRDQKKTLCTAESCTGGFIAHKITSVPGSSEYYKGSVIAYANEIKVGELGVDMHILEEYGAVSEQVVAAMAKNALRKFHTDYVITCSGIAGPDGGTKEKPVGTVWIAVSDFEKTITRKLLLGNNRQRVITETAQHSLNILRKMLIGKYL
jgi:nicotinamide-nucleotide amidase